MTQAWRDTHLFPCFQPPAHRPRTDTPTTWKGLAPQLLTSSLLGNVVG